MYKKMHAHIHLQSNTISLIPVAVLTRNFSTFYGQSKRSKSVHLKLSDSTCTERERERERERETSAERCVIYRELPYQQWIEFSERMVSSQSCIFHVNTMSTLILTFIRNSVVEFAPHYMRNISPNWHNDPKDAWATVTTCSFCLMLHVKPDHLRC